MPNMSQMLHPRLAIMAHQGGWDEILLVAGPIVIIVAVLAVAKRRVDARFDADRAEHHDHVARDGS